jgi:hypothetical protein
LVSRIESVAAAFLDCKYIIRKVLCMLADM